MKNRNAETLAQALIIAMFLLAMMSWSSVPAQIPIHWDISGQVDAYGSKFTGLLLLPIIALAGYLLIGLTAVFSPAQFQGRAMNALSWFRLTYVLVMAGVFGVIVADVRGANINMNYVIFPLLALMVIAIVNLLMQYEPQQIGQDAAAKRRSPGLMAQLFRQMTVCGVGLIGGSLALIARRAGVVGKVVGLGRSQANLDVALDRGMIDIATRDPVEAARGADLIVLAVPILTMRATLEKMIEHTAPDAVVTDVGSVKQYVVRELEPLITGKRSLVAAHPVAGKETTGAAAADPALFRDRRVILTPSAKSTPDAINKIEQLWNETGACVEMMDAATHDAILARSSHLPQAVSSVLAAALNTEKIGDKLAVEYGAGGFARYDAAGCVVVGDVARYFRDQSRGDSRGAETLRWQPSPNFSARSKPATWTTSRRFSIAAARCGKSSDDPQETNYRD